MNTAPLDLDAIRRRSAMPDEARAILCAASDPRICVYEDGVLVQIKELLAALEVHS